MRALGQLDAALDHRQDKALDAIAIVAQVGHLGGIQPLLDPLARMVFGQQLHKPRLGVGIQALGVPERVVGVESDQFQHAGGNFTTEWKRDPGGGESSTFI